MTGPLIREGHPLKRVGFFRRSNVYMTDTQTNKNDVMKSKQVESDTRKVPSCRRCSAISWRTGAVSTMAVDSARTGGRYVCLFVRSGISHVLRTRGRERQIRERAAACGRFHYKEKRRGESNSEAYTTSALTACPTQTLGLLVTL